MTEIDHAELTEMASSEEHHQRLVAVLIITVTLVGAVVAFLQTQAGTREATADRNEQASSIDTMAALVETTRRDAIESFSYDTSNDLDWLGFAYETVQQRGGAVDPFAGALGRANRAAARKLAAFRASLFDGKYELGDNRFDTIAFYEDEWKPFYRASELQKAYATERDGWGSKSDRYVTVITVFAVSLFLLGLSLTVPGGAQKPFLWMGTGVGLAAAVWGAIVFAGSIEKPALAAIDAYVRAQAKADFAEGTGDTPAVRASFQRVIRDASRAIEVRDDYTEAYILRANAAFTLDFLRSDGPRGSEAAKEDLERATSLDPKNYVSWGNLGAAQFWLDDYRAALRSTNHALELQPRDEIFNMNRALVLSILDEPEQYRDQLAAVRSVLANEPSWTRNSAVSRYQDVFELGLKYRPHIADGIARFRDSLHRIDREIANSLRLIGDTTPKHLDSTISDFRFELSADRTVLEVHFAYEGMETGQPWLYDTYVDGERSDALSAPPQKWSFDVPDGGIVLTLTDAAGWKRGAAARVEVFVEGNLLGIGRYTVR